MTLQIVLACLGNSIKGNELCNPVPSYAIKDYSCHKTIRLYINMKLVIFVNGDHVPACIHYIINVFILFCFCYLPLFKAAHVANKAVGLYTNLSAFIVYMLMTHYLLRRH